MSKLGDPQGFSVATFLVADFAHWLEGFPVVLGFFFCVFFVFFFDDIFPVKLFRPSCIQSHG